MIETAAVIGMVGTIVISTASLWYKFGRLETKVNFIYDNLKTTVSFKTNNKK